MPRRREFPLSSLVVTKSIHQLFCCLVTEEVPDSSDVDQVIQAALHMQGVDVFVHGRITVEDDSQVPGCCCKNHATLTKSDVDSGRSCWGLRAMKTASVFPSLSISLFVLIHAAISDMHDSSRLIHSTIHTIQIKDGQIHTCIYNGNHIEFSTPCYAGATTVPWSLRGCKGPFRIINI